MRAWWSSQREGLSRGLRYFAGHPLDPAIAEQALRYAPMRRRHALALELADSIPPGAQRTEAIAGTARRLGLGFPSLRFQPETASGLPTTAATTSGSG